MNNNRRVVVGLGEVLWDLLPGGRRLGGAPANFAYHAGVLGAAACVVSRVGDDADGRAILAELDKAALDRRYVQVDAGHPTGTVSVELSADGKPTYVIHEGVAWDFLGFAPDLAELANRADAVCFGSLAQRSPVSRATIQQFLVATRPDCLRIFDINLRQHYYDEPTLAAGLQMTNVLKLNDEELPVVARLFGIEGGMDELLAAILRRFDLRMIALTRGGDGATLATANGIVSQPSVPVQVVDTVGAGDAFTAALATGLLTGQEPATILQRASRLASYVCGVSGAMPKVPAELLEMLRG